MDEWFARLREEQTLPTAAADDLMQRGFVVLPGPIPIDAIPKLQHAYDAAVANAAEADIGRGRTSTRVNDFVNRGPEFDAVYARPMLGLILMVDAFGADKGATRFVPGSHRWTESPGEMLSDPFAPHPAEVLACGPAGSVILFNASTWHGHTANTSATPRRSLQATFIPRDGKPAVNFAARMQPETYARMSGLTRYVVGVGSPVDAEAENGAIEFAALPQTLISLCDS